MAGREDGIVIDVVDVMRADPLAAVPRHLRGIAGHGVLIHAGMAAHDAAEGQNVALGISQILVHPAEGLQEDVDALVMELVASGNDDDARLFGEFPAQKSLGAAYDSGAVGLGTGALLREIGDDAQVEAVRGDDVGLPAENDAGFFGRDVAHRGEAVSFPGRGCFHGALGRNAERSRFPAGIEFGGQHGIEVAAVAGEGAAEHGGVRCKDRPHGRAVALEVEESGAAHPFVELGYGRAAYGLEHVLVDGRDDLAAGRGEHDRLDVVPAAGHGVDLVFLPVFVEELVLVVAVAEIDQDDLGLAGDIPVSEAAFQVVRLEDFADGLDDGVAVFLEIRVVAQIRSEKPVILPEVFDGLKGFAADDGVDAAYFIADFPRGLKQRDIAIIHQEPPKSMKSCEKWFASVLFRPH